MEEIIIQKETTKEFFDFVVKYLNKICKASQVLKMQVAEDNGFLYGIVFYREKQEELFSQRLFKLDLSDNRLYFQTNQKVVDIENLECKKKSGKFKGNLWK